MISLDLRKAFDRIEYVLLFEVLRDQGVFEPYVQLLMALYQDQKGIVNGNGFFIILRGVK